MRIFPAILYFVAAAIWCGGVNRLTHRMPAGLSFDGGTEGLVSAVSVYSGGYEVESEKSGIRLDGTVSVPVDRSAQTFYFRMYPPPPVKRPDKTAVLPLRNIRICSIPAIDASRAARFCMRKRLYSTPPANRHSPLLLNVSEGDPLDLTNAFPYILRVYRAAALCLAWLPLAAVAAFLVWRFLLNRLSQQTVSALKKPVVFTAAAIATAVLALPAPVTPAQPGLDPSWIWTLNHFAGTKVFGSGLVFTYGPLGFLIFPQLSGANVAAGMAVNIGFSALFVYVALLLRRKCLFPAFALLLVWLLPWPNGMEWKWCMVSIMACALAALGAASEMRNHERTVLFVSAALTAVLQSFVKFSSCVNVLGQQLFLVVFYLLRERRKAVPGALAYAAALFVSFAGFAATLFGSAASFADWVRGSMEIAAGYNLVMACDKPLPDILCTLSAVAVFAAFVLSVGKKHIAASILYWLAFAPFLFCGYKYAVVRQSAVPLLLGISCLSVMLPASIPALSRRALAMAAFFALAAMACSVIWCGGALRPGISISALTANLRPKSALAKARAAAENEIAAARLPDAWLDRIGTNRVMVVGWDMGPAMSGGLNLAPFPAMQTYSAYTPWLDERCAERVARETDPIRFVLAPAEPWTFDSRNIYFDNPRLWDSVKRRFAFVDMSADHVLLERRSSPAASPETSVRQKFRQQRPFSDRLAALVFRPARTMAVFSFADGSKYTCDANIETLYGTPLPEILPRSPADMPAFFGSNAAPAPPKVVSVEIQAPFAQFPLARDN